MTMGKKRSKKSAPKADLTPSKETVGDQIHTLARAGIAAIPVVGGPAVELFNVVIAPPIRKRQQEWMELIAEGLRLLEEKQRCIVDDLKDNNAFIDTVMQASQAVVRTANEEKREALRNAVLNAALPNSPDEAKRQIFVNFVDELSSWHLRILSLFADPPKWFTDHGRIVPQWSIAGSLSQLLTMAYPELQSQREFYDITGKDLFQRGLLNTDGLHAVMSGQGAVAKRTTGFADEFLNFISDPRK
jgi:hypothetical protein